MAEYSDADHVAFLTGEIHALQAFVQVLAGNHPDPLQLARDAAANFQAGLAKTEANPVADAMLDGFQWMANELTSAIPGARRGS
jgi:hypothetical protein